MKRWAARILRLLIVIAVVGGLVLGARVLIARKKAELAKAPKYDVGPMPVYVVAAKQGTLIEKRDYLAVVEPIRIANISARLTATVEEVLCDEGDVVHSGDVLITLDGREIRDDIASVQAQIEQARADLASNESTVASLVESVAYWDREAKRDASLAEKGHIAGAQAEATADKANTFQGKLDAARSKSTAIKHLTESLNQKKSQLETRLGYCTIRSPYDGLVTSRLVDPGDLALPGKTLIVVEDRSELKLAFDVPQQDLPRVGEGLDVTFAVGDAARKAQLSHLYPSLNLARMLRAEVFLSSRQAQGLARCGAYVPISVVIGRTEGVMLVPGNCVVEGPKGKAHVFVVRNGILAHLTVQVLGSSGDSVAVKGIKPGEQIVTNTFLGWARLSAGRKAEVVK